MTWATASPESPRQAPAASSLSRSERNSAKPRRSVEPGKARDGAVSQRIGDQDHRDRGVGHRGIDAERTLPEPGVNEIARHIEIESGQGGGDAERQRGAHQFPLADRRPARCDAWCAWAAKRRPRGTSKPEEGGEPDEREKDASP